jgi:putative ABC transport system permease protein
MAPSRSRGEDDFQREIEAHIALETDRLIADGLPRAAARDTARRAFGNVAAASERYYESRRPMWLIDVGRDIRYGIRLLARHPGLTLVAVLTLALGIGANTAIFSLINSVMLRPLPVRDPGCLVVVGGIGRGFPAWEWLQREAGRFEGVAAWGPSQFDLSSGGETHWVDGLWASGSFFDTLGVPAVLGRTLINADDRRGAQPVTVISYAFWQREFGGSADVVGRSLPINRTDFTIVGVTPPGFFGPVVGRTFDVVVPLSAFGLIMPEAWLDTNFGFLTMMARLRPDQTPGEATAGLAPMTLVPAATEQSYFRGQYARPLYTLMAVVGLVLLVACATIANLLLARATARRQEMSVRLAIGGSRWRLVRQLLTECVVLSACGAVGGVIIAALGSRFLVTQLSAESVLTTGRVAYGSARLFLDVSTDWHVLAFTTMVALGTALMFGVAPALRASGIAPIDVLKESGPTFDSGAKASSGFVIAQLALSLVLVVAASLLIRTFSSLANLQLGFEPDRVLIVDVDAGRSPIEADARLALYKRALDVVRAVPGVSAAAISNATPATRGGLFAPVTLAGVQAINAVLMVVSPGLFRTFGTPLLAGRDFTSADRRNAPPVVLVNQSFARSLPRGVSAVGSNIALPTRERKARMQIVGVVADTAAWPLRDPIPPAVFFPLEQADDMLLELSLEEQGLSVSVRADQGRPQRLTRAIGTALGEVDPGLALTFRSPADEIAASLTQERVVAVLSGLFGVLAVGLAALGLYGVTAYAVARRRTEIGIRIAVGAGSLDVIRLVLGQSVAVTLVGITLGLAGAAAVTRYLEGLLFGLTPLDPGTFAGVSLLFVVVAMLAAFIPARRATRVDPVVTLRAE